MIKSLFWKIDSCCVFWNWRWHIPYICIWHCKQCHILGKCSFFGTGFPETNCLVRITLTILTVILQRRTMMQTMLMMIMCQRWTGMYGLVRFHRDSTCPRQPHQFHLSTCIPVIIIILIIIIHPFLFFIEIMTSNVWLVGDRLLILTFHCTNCVSVVPSTMFTIVLALIIYFEMVRWWECMSSDRKWSW